ncbi:hypothetical protein OIU77_031143 [Salix suchowensis]|uniref:Uncharacterized protein n=1 Tax=Salix suchowensis TaxID=1278906 RepID=A0ABQ9BH32_9ROSI|nr:hypothetical protein OIU77_031143 [Salix suchowensis]
MLALIQVERAFIHPMSKVYGSVLERGLNTEPGKTQHWVTKTQQQSGTRWLVASGMSKSYKQPFSKSKAIVLAYPTTNQKGGGR